MKNSTTQNDRFYSAIFYFLMLSLTLVIACTKDMMNNDSLSENNLEERAVITYNEGLATVFRGIITDRFSSRQKYYKMR